ncbi:hypothetical protein BRC96_00495 [Halobacteriales archaeon QS_6_64_34]|nr:MAG: hypothetical protein BRC96_00495 [Halobacteriales archaeon QS_6_64_34]
MGIENPTPTQQYVLDLLDSEPGMSNADIAEETGTHTALVRDLRKAKHAAVESDDDGSPGKLSSRTRVLDSLSGTQAAVLQRVAQDPDLSNADLAEAVGTHTALVRDLRSDVQAEVLAHTLGNPDATNAEIAEQLGTLTAVVRDARSGLEAEILEQSVRNPELSNAELAEELGVHIATVRDARATYADGIEDIDLTASDDGATVAAEPATADGGSEMGPEAIVAVLVGALLLVAVVLLLV